MSSDRTAVGAGSPTAHEETAEETRAEIGSVGSWARRKGRALGNGARWGWTRGGMGSLEHRHLLHCKLTHKQDNNLIRASNRLASWCLLDAHHLSHLPNHLSEPNENKKTSNTVPMKSDSNKERYIMLLTAKESFRCGLRERRPSSVSPSFYDH